MSHGLHYFFCLRTICRYQKLNADGNPVGDICHCARRVTSDGEFSAYLKEVRPLVPVPNSGSWFKPQRFPNLRAAFTSLRASVPTLSATPCPSNTILSLTASSLTGILAGQTDRMPEGTFQPAFAAKVRDDYEKRDKTNLERHLLVVDGRKTAALEALTESRGGFLCAEASQVGASRVAVEGESFRNVVASVAWAQALGSLNSGYEAHVRAESAKYALDEASSEGLVFGLFKGEAVDIVLVTAEYLPTLRMLYGPDGTDAPRAFCHDYDNMRKKTRICYDSVILAALADPRGAAVALHDESLRAQHAVLESYQTTMPPAIACLGVNNQKRKKWQSKEKWRLHQAHLLEQEQRAAAAAAAAQEEEAAVAAAAEDAMDTSDVHQESMEV